MSILADSIEKLLSIKLKRREDGVTDQYNRIVMTKMCMLFAAVIGFNYFNDKVACIVANSDDMGGDFVGSACWIQGFYIYKDLRGRLSESAYFGIPRNMDYDGLNSEGVLCSTNDRALDKVSTCTPMKKEFYLQYQYMPFLIAAFAMLFYLPYIVFKLINTDLVSLKDTIKEGKGDAELIMQSFFNREINTQRKMRYRAVTMVFIRALYLLANLVAFLGTNKIFNGNFLTYGQRVVYWSLLDNDVQHEHNLKYRDVAKPGNQLIPAMGYCDVNEASRDVRNTRINYHKLLCEISPHVLYQYVMILMWFFLIVGIILSVVGLLIAIFGHVINFVTFMNAKDHSRPLYKVLTVREVDYLEYIRRKDLPLYSQVLELLRESRLRVDDNEKESYKM